MTKLVFCLIILSVFRIFHAAKTFQKPGVLTMLALVPEDERAIHGGIGCEMAMQVAVNNVNNRSDILPRYSLEISYQEEGEDVEEKKGFAVRNFFNFLENATRDYRTISPIVVGSLSPNGCQFVGAFAHIYDMVEIAMGCVYPMFTAKRKQFPNFYRATASDEITVYPIIRFVRDVGKWSRVAIYATSIIEYDYLMAGVAYDLFIKEGIHVAWFNEFPAVDDNFASLKAANARIIVIFVLAPDILFLTLCQWNSAGIRPDTGYVFILRTIIALEEKEMFDFFKHICPKAILISQLTSTFFIGTIETPNFIPGNNIEKSSLGYDITVFDEQFDGLVRQRTFTPSRYLKAYAIRTRCHDAMLQAIVTLDHAEKLLNAQNMTLSDYKLSPKIVADIVNRSAAAVNYTGIRGAGPKTYSERVEFDNEILQIKQYFTGTYGTGTMLYTVNKVKPWPFNSSSFEIYQYQTPNWVFSTKPDEPPNDSWSVRTNVVSFPSEVPTFVLAYSITLISAQILIFARNVWLSRVDGLKYQQPNRFVILSGCIVMNLAAIAFVQESPTICLVRFALTVLGLSLFHGTVFFKLLLLYHPTSRASSGKLLIRLQSLTKSSSDKGKRQRKKADQPGHVAASESNKNQPKYADSHLSHQEAQLIINSETLKWRDRLIVFLSLFFFAINGAVLAAWFVIDPPRIAITDFSKEPRYEIKTDTYVYEKIRSCLSSSGVNEGWIGVFACLHGLVLLVSVFLSYDLRRLKLQISHQATDMLQTRVAAINSAIMLAAVAVIMFIFSTSPLIQHEIAAFSLLVESTVQTVTIFVTGSQLKKSVQVEPSERGRTDSIYRRPPP